MNVDLGPARELVFPHNGRKFVKTNGVWHPQEISASAHLIRQPVISPAVKAALDIWCAGWVDAVEVDILEHFFQGAALPNTPSHIGLFTTTPADDGTGGVEVSGGSYAREAFAANNTNWGNSTPGAPSTIENLVAVEFTTATASWGTVTAWGYFDAATTGNLLFFAVLDTSKAIGEGDTASFAIGAMSAQLGDPGDF